MQDLNDLVVSELDATLIRATDIADNENIVAWGRDPSGRIHSFLLTPRLPRARPRREAN